ncbi:monoacylglycerol lipase abhd6-B-like isoform X2 [Branchiostoma floridae]|uniref:acylglycerol lipase n=1 Tax=Branchiostoma floridae TaxID=7739 RepID=A0A9J7N2R6_BRAFL|nr:monoacylglycerol lipase abhd6-B-like isoform X2 [Branchiostoma floridae]
MLDRAASDLMRGQASGQSDIGSGAFSFSLSPIIPVAAHAHWERFNTWRAGCTTKYVKVGEQQFAYMERGRPSKDQPSLLLIHGFADRKESYCDMIMHLPKHLHLIAVDLPGHGDTGIKAKADLTVEAYAAKLHQFVSAVGLDSDPLHVVGHSMGGGLAGCYAAFYPEAVSLLTMSGPGGVKSPVQSLMFEKVAQGYKQVMVPETVEQAVEMFNICLYNKSLIPPKQLVKGFLDCYMLPRLSFLKELFDAILEQQDGLTPYLGKISAPTQLMWGRHEQVLHITCVDVIQREMTAPLQVDIIEDSGHTIPAESPEKAAKLMLGFRDKFVNKQNKS